MKRSIGTIAAIIFFSLFAIYGLFEVAKVALGPSLTITSPKDIDTVSNALIDVSGRAVRAAYLTINDRQIFADPNGAFSDKLLLLPGYNIIEVKVKDKFGKEKSKRIAITYTPLE